MDQQWLSTAALENVNRRRFQMQSIVENRFLSKQHNRNVKWLQTHGRLWKYLIKIYQFIGTGLSTKKIEYICLHAAHHGFGRSHLIHDANDFACWNFCSQNELEFVETCVFTVVEVRNEASE